MVKRISCNITDREHNLIAGYAKSNGIKIGEYIAYLVKKEISNFPKEIRENDLNIGEYDKNVQDRDKI